jgi:hypothetical protein
VAVISLFSWAGGENHDSMLYNLEQPLSSPPEMNNRRIYIGEDVQL